MVCQHISMIPRREKRSFYYTPAFSKRHYNQNLINETLGKTYGDLLEMSLASFCGKASVSSKDIDHIRSCLKDVEQKQKLFP